MQDEQLFHGEYRIPTARAKWITYSDGMYFITICTKYMRHYFGEIKGTAEPRMLLSEIGLYTDLQLRTIPQHHPYCEILHYVIMPNHLHFIAMMNSTKAPNQRTKTDNIAGVHEVDKAKGWLSIAVGGMKSYVTRYARQKGIEFAWQSRFHDRLIRNVDEMNRISEYISNNVYRWHYDCYNV